MAFRRSLFGLCTVLMLGGACRGGVRPREVPMDLQIPAIPRGGAIPKSFTADGADASPALAWAGVPSGTQAFALILDDPDAPSGLWTHWVLFDVPASARALAENLPKAPVLQDGSKQGKNSWGRLGYNGPSPPPGKPHHYHFRLYALSQPLDLPAGATQAEVEKAMRGKILAEAAWMATYGR